MIKLKKIKKSYGDKTVLNGVDLTVEKGERIAIIGESGCGKSTILRMILGLQFPDSGSVLYKRKDIFKMTKKAQRDMRLKVGFLFQSGALFDSMTVGENVAFSLMENFGNSYEEVEDRVSYLLDLVGMPGYEDAMPASLSGGQRKRVGMARTIASEPEVVMYDEPTTGLDPVLSTSIEDLIVKLNKEFNITSIVVSHQKSTILRTVDKIYMMDSGKLLDAETPKSIERSKDPVIYNFIRGGL